MKRTFHTYVFMTTKSYWSK